MPTLRSAPYGASFLLLALHFGLPLQAAEDPFKALVRTTDPLSPAEEQAALKPPTGFEVQLFAAEPQINKPINLAFDARGRMWVSSTVEYPFPAAKDRWLDAAGSRVRDSRDAIKILTDSDGDGRADRVTDFADGLNIPIGVLPYANGCIAWSIPNIWYLEDTDGDDRCDRRTILFGPAGYERDVHGNVGSLRLAPDGWVYATHGFSNTSRLQVTPERLAGRVPGSPGTIVEMQSGNTFRFRPDGSAIEPWTRGQVNPFGLCFDSWGHLYSADCHSDPVTQLLRGAYYPSFGKPHDGLGFGPVMCPHRHDSTGLCGVIYVDRELWGPQWNDSILIGNCVTSRINCDRVRFTGATARAVEQPDFLTASDPWFRPVDLQIGPDGALYVADFYNRIIGHYEVDLQHPGRDRERGRIWRVSRSGTSNPPKLSPLAPEQQLATRQRWQMNSQPTWTTAETAAALALAFDSKTDARVRRVALEGVAFHTDFANLPFLLTTPLNAAADDPALLQTFRIALRNHLQLPDGLAVLARTDHLTVPPAELQCVVRAVGSPEAAQWLLDNLVGGSSAGEEPVATLGLLSRQLPEDELPRLLNWVREKLKAPGEFERLQAVRDGLALRGKKNWPPLANWAAALADELCRRSTDKSARASQALMQAAELVELFRLHQVAAELAPALDRNDLTPDAKQEIAAALAHFPQFRAAIANVFKAAPTRVQLQIAETLAGSLDGANELLALAPPVLLIDPTVAARLAAHHNPRLDQLVKDRTRNLPSTSQDVSKLLKKRLQGFQQALQRKRVDPAAGQKLFVTHCSACHKMRAIGQVVGPQLDGMHNRGAERLCEDILDPNRAVDPMFRMQVFLLDDGTVLSGLVRREDLEAVVVADQQGRERSLAKGDIETRSESALSLMPVGFATVLPEADFYNLLAWLLAK